MFKVQLMVLCLTLYAESSSSAVVMNWKSNSSAGVLTPEIIKNFRYHFDSDDRNIQSLNMGVRTDPIAPCVSRQTVQNTTFTFQHRIHEVRPITNQKSSGRCWIFAALNVMRVPFIKEYNLTTFEFSQAYLFFWDKIERSNAFLRNIVKAANEGLKMDDRLMRSLLGSPVSDGGDWGMVVNLINRYGLIPKTSFSESWTSSNSGRMNSLLRSKLLEYSQVLMALVAEGADYDEIEEKIQMQMIVVFRIVSICLGIPPETITWEYYDKSGKYHRIGPITPLDFYKKHVQPYYNVDDKVYLINDPRESYPFGHLYESKYFNNVVSDRGLLFNNQPIEILMNASAASIKDKEGVWFSCDFGKRYEYQSGILDIKVHDIESVFGVDIQLDLPKAERIEYLASWASHALVFTGVSYDTEGKIAKFRVENSWDGNHGDNGYEILTGDWFKEFVFGVVVDKKYLSTEVLAVLKQEPVQLPPWSLMSSLSCDSQEKMIRPA